LALYDYMRKSHSNGFILSLSGGADSAACACLVDLMANKTNQKTKDILTTIYQSTNSSSFETMSAAAMLAESIGSTHYDWSVNDVKEIYTEKIEQAIGRELTWENDDITMQNIQARVRLPGIWMLANIKNALLLCTSNRSESAVGYSTINGDLSGSIGPLSGIDKPFILEWLNYMYIERSYTGLKKVLEQKPSAELRPGGKQEDQVELMPYVVLDAIEKAVVRDKKFPKDVLITIMSQFTDYSKEQLKEWTRKFFKLFIKNQWKREMTPISFHLDDESLDPKSFLRWPILCGNMEEYLKEMDDV